MGQGRVPADVWAYVYLIPAVISFVSLCWLVLTSFSSMMVQERASDFVWDTMLYPILGVSLLLVLPVFLTKSLPHLNLLQRLLGCVSIMVFHYWALSELAGRLLINENNAVTEIVDCQLRADGFEVETTNFVFTTYEMDFTGRTIGAENVYLTREAYEKIHANRSLQGFCVEKGSYDWLVLKDRSEG